MTEAVNRVVEKYLRCFSGELLKKWLSWIAWAEFCYNTGFHFSFRATPFEVVYGRTPPRLLSYCPVGSKFEVVDHELLSICQTLDLLRSRLLQAQNTMKTDYDSSHRDVHFHVGDHVLLRLQPNCQTSIAARSNKKLSPRYYGPFKVIAKVGQVAYKLRLPETSQIHPVFHVLCLKPFKGNVLYTSELPASRPATPGASPQKVLDSRR